MRSAVDAKGRLVVDAELAAGSAAFFDREWVSPEPGTAVPAIVLTGTAAERLAEAALALASIACDAVAAAGDGPVAVTGSGFIAQDARRRLAAGGRLAAAGERSPAAVIETTGDPRAVVAATRQVRNLGRVVLAGEPLDRAYPLDVYADLHLRGLHLIARGRPGAAVPGATDIEAGPESRLQTVAPGEPLDTTALWFCVMSDATRGTGWEHSVQDVAVAGDPGELPALPGEHPAR